MAIDLNTKQIIAVLQEVWSTDNMALAIRAKDEGATVLEYRVDLVGGTLADHEHNLAGLRCAGLPMLLTIRSEQEGGNFKVKDQDQERLAMFEALLPLVDAVDIELSSVSIRKHVIELARDAGKFSVASVHNFSATPSMDAMETFAEDAAELGADVVKMAFMPQSKRDVETLSAFTHRYKKLPLVTMSMGELGAPSRVINLLLGSRFTYGFVGSRPAAPGQIKINEIVKELAAFEGQPVTLEQAKHYMAAYWARRHIAEPSH